MCSKIYQLRFELDEEEGYDSDDGQDLVVEAVSITENELPKTGEMSWLLKIVLENLMAVSPTTQTVSYSTSFCDFLIIAVFYMVKAKMDTPALVLIESLHVISSMARHFFLLKDHLNPIGTALLLLLIEKDGESALNVRLSAVKCFDILGHFMNVYMTNDGEFSFNNHPYSILYNTYYSILKFLPK